MIMKKIEAKYIEKQAELDLIKSKLSKAKIKYLNAIEKC